MNDTERNRIITRFAEILDDARSVTVTDHPSESRPVRSRWEGYGAPREHITFPAWTEIDREALQRWAMRCELALADLGDAAATARAAWMALGDLGKWNKTSLGRARGIIDALLFELRAGRIIEPLSARTRARTEYELVDHARAALAEGDGWAVVGAVLAGAALELRLHRIAVGRVAVPPKTTLGGLITLLRKARDTGTPTIDVSDDTLLDRWRDIRNDAAHRPTKFPWAVDRLEAELAPLEEFLRRAPVEHV